MKWLADIPITNIRILVTLLIVVGTAMAHLWTGYEADGGWLTFLATMAGIDAFQHIGKRATTKVELMPAAGGEPQPAVAADALPPDLRWPWPEGEPAGASAPVDRLDEVGA